MIDENEAPEGFVAKSIGPLDGCLGCFFRRDLKCQRSFADCLGGNRKDGQDVIFVLKGF